MTDGMMPFLKKRPFDLSQFAEVYRVYDTGVYGLMNTSRHAVYVGSTMIGFRPRWGAHLHHLANGRHWNVPLQHDWDVDGEKAFTFIIFQELHATKSLKLYEQFWVESLRAHAVSCYNLVDPLHRDSPELQVLEDTPPVRSRVARKRYRAPDGYLDLLDIAAMIGAPYITVYTWFVRRHTMLGAVRDGRRWIVPETSLSTLLFGKFRDVSIG